MALIQQMASLPKLDKSRHFIVPAMMLMIIPIILAPMPTLVLDFLFALNFSISILLILVSMYILRPLDMSSFPSILLITTSFRLALNISSTRLILQHGNEGTDAAGKMIESFGKYVAGGNLIIGIVVFAVIIIIQFVVINHGAGRIAEVTARFTLDAMPGKQMSIDADLNAGLINENEARRRRKEVSEEAEFYGAMDGAIKFTQRDAIASLIITAINLLAGIGIGLIQYQMSITDAMEVFSILTIGDGLVSAIPSLFISLSGAMLTTRSTAKDTLGIDVLNQLFQNSYALYLSGGILIFVGVFVKGMPLLPFVALGGIILYVAQRMKLNKEKQQAIALQTTTKPKAKLSHEEEAQQVVSLMKLDPLLLEVGYNLIPLADPGQENNLVDRIKQMRKEIALEIGFVSPAVSLKR